MAIFSNPNIIAKLKDERKELSLKITRLENFVNKHFDADNKCIGDIEDDFYSDCFIAQRSTLEDQYSAMIKYLNALNKRINILETFEANHNEN